MLTHIPGPSGPAAQGPGLQSPTPPAPPSVAPPALPQSAGQALESLASQLVSLQMQRNFLLDKLGSTPAAGQPVLRAQLAGIDAQIASVRAQIATVSAQLRNTRPGHRNFTPPFFPGNSGMTDNATALSVVFVLAVLMPVSIAFARGIWRRSSKMTPSQSAEPIPSPRLERLEQAVDAIAIEVERISEGQRFITKILADRPASSSNGQGQAAAAPGDPPFRALGAGPIEPIVVAEKQRVRPSITPH